MTGHGGPGQPDRRCPRFPRRCTRRGPRLPAGCCVVPRQPGRQRLDACSCPANHDVVGDTITFPRQRARFIMWIANDMLSFAAYICTVSLSWRGGSHDEHLGTRQRQAPGRGIARGPVQGPGRPDPRHHRFPGAGRLLLRRRRRGHDLAVRQVRWSSTSGCTTRGTSSASPATDGSGRPPWKSASSCAARCPGSWPACSGSSSPASSPSRSSTRRSATSPAATPSWPR